MSATTRPNRRSSGNSTGPGRASALHHAVGSGRVECVEYLLQAGLSPNHCDRERRT